MNKDVGICSLCGAAVRVPLVWYGVEPPVPECSSCHAVEDKSKTLPVLPMKRVFREEDYFPRIKK